jgi:hypothetical protein
VVRTIRTAKILRTIMPSPLEALGWARWVLKSYSDWGYRKQAGIELVNESVCKSSRSKSGSSQSCSAIDRHKPVECTFWWKPPHLCGGRSASALREKFGFDHAL